MRRVGYEEIGYKRTFETMVFRAGEPCSCGCGLPTIVGAELDFRAYSDAGSANSGHRKLCETWAEVVERDDADLVATKTGNSVASVCE